MPVPANGGLTLTFGTNSRATLTTAFATRQAELTARTAQYLVLTDLDSSSTSTSNSAPYRCGTLADQIRLVNPVQRCSALPPATGYTRSCRFRQVQVVIVRDAALFLSLFSWLIYSNLFNPALAGQLLAGDTVVVQTREVALLMK